MHLVVSPAKTGLKPATDFNAKLHIFVSSCPSTSHPRSGVLDEYHPVLLLPNTA